MSEATGVLNDREDFDEDEVVNFYEVTVAFPTYIVRVYAETPEDAEDMVLDDLYESVTFTDILGDADVKTDKVSS